MLPKENGLRHHLFEKLLLVGWLAAIDALVELEQGLCGHSQLSPFSALERLANNETHLTFCAYIWGLGFAATAPGAVPAKPNIIFKPLPDSVPLKIQVSSECSTAVRYGTLSFAA